MTKRKSRRPARGKRTVRMWGGFCEDKLYLKFEHDSYGACVSPSIFKRRSDAQKRFEDVRPVTVTYSNPKPKRRTRG